MPTLTKEQKTYIKEHPKESTYKMANDFGCSPEAIYYWLHKYHGDSFLEKKKAETEYKHKVIRELYPAHSASEVANILGVTKAAVNNMARRLGVRHTKETDDRILKENVSRMLSPDTIKKRSNSLRKTLRLEKFRILSGGQQKTKRKFKVVANKQLCAKYYLCRQYNYFYDQDAGDILLVFYDKDTRRMPTEREKYYSSKYGIKFEQADEE